MTTKTSYDPAYCLAEHLTYFQDNVAFDINASDFDDIFGDTEAIYMTSKASHEPVCTAERVHVPNPLSSELKAMPPLTSSSKILESPTSVREILSDQELPPIVVELEQRVVTQSPACFNTVSDDETNSVGETESVYFSPIVTSLPVETESALEPLSSTMESSMVPLAPVPSQNATKEKSVAKTSKTPKKASRKRKSLAEGGPDIRRERNRLHAKKSRERKREYNQCLQESVEALKEENEWLLSVINKQFKVLGEAPAPSLEQTNEEDFIAALRNPTNRVLGDETLEDLRTYFN